MSDLIDSSPDTWVKYCGLIASVITQSSDADPIRSRQKDDPGIHSLSLSVCAYENVIQAQEKEFKELSLTPKQHSHVDGEYRDDLAFLEAKLRRLRAMLADSHGVHDQGESIVVRAPRLAGIS